MFTTLNHNFKIDNAERVNLFFYYFKKLPFLGKIVSDSVYQLLEFKQTVGILLLIFSIFSNLIKKILYIGLCAFLPSYILFAQDNTKLMFPCFIHIIFVLSFLIGPIVMSETFEVDQKKFIAVQLLRIPVKTYLQSNIFKKVIVDTIYYYPSTIIFTVLAKGTLLQGFLLPFLIMLARLIGEACNLFVFQKFKLMICKNTALSLILYAILGSFCYIPVLMRLQIPTAFYLFHIVTILVLLLVAFLSFQYILHYKYYKEAFLATNKIDTLTLNKKTIKNNTSFSYVKLNDKDYNSSYTLSTKINEKHGYDFLNAVFFQRHRRILLKPMYYTLALAPIILIGGLLINPFFPAFSEKYIPIIRALIGVLIYFMYTISLFLGQKATKAMFYNCDISLLRYGFYREKSVILNNFTLRLKMVTAISMIPTLGLSAAIYILGYIVNPQQSEQLIPIVILLILLTLFFVVHHLFMYYVFQPFTTQLDVKNPFYKIINAIIYVLCYICMQLRQPPDIFVYIVSVATVVYTIIALILVYHLSPKYFRVK